MNQREVLSTDSVLPQRRVEYWNDAACDSLTQQVAEPLNPRTFSGRMIRADVGNVRFVELSSDAAVVRHSRAHIARSNGAYFLVRFQLGNESVCSQGGEDVHLRPGDFSLCDTARPYQLAFKRPVSILTLRAPVPHPMTSRSHGLPARRGRRLRCCRRLECAPGSPGSRRSAAVHSSQHAT